LNPGRGKVFTSFPYTGFWAHRISYSVAFGGLFPGGEPLGLRLKMSEATLSLFRMPAWYAQGKICLFFM
jgi:hypothetical protein